MSVIELPATTVAATLLGGLFLLLTLAVMRLRLRHGVGLGDGGHEDLHRAIRAQGNFVENVPLTLLLLALVEGQLGTTTFTWACALLLSAGRAAHGAGLYRSAGASLARRGGALVTLGIQGLLLIALAYQVVMESGVMMLFER